MNKLNKKGFTLVELLAVIVVLALLMVVAGSSIGNALKNSKVKTLQTEAQKIVNKINEEAQVSLMLHNEITSDAFSSNVKVHTFSDINNAALGAFFAKTVGKSTDDGPGDNEYKFGSSTVDTRRLVQVKDGNYVVWAILNSVDKNYKITELCVEGEGVLFGMAEASGKTYAKPILKGGSIDFSWPLYQNVNPNSFLTNPKTIGGVQTPVMYVYIGEQYTCGMGKSTGNLLVSNGTLDVLPDGKFSEDKKQKDGKYTRWFSKNNLDIFKF